jgi:hypothetical protein
VSAVSAVSAVPLVARHDVPVAPPQVAPPLDAAGPDALAHLAAIERAAAGLAAIPLDGLGTAALMDRVDTKFVLPVHLVPDVLHRCAGRYRALAVGGLRLCRYGTLYFDTADLAFYHAHHAGRATRRKIRVRSYLDAGEHYLEVKLRTNRGRTRKSRVPVADASSRALAQLDGPAFRDVLDPGAAPALREVVRVRYTRLTLVHAEAAERVTLDLRLAFASDAGAASYPGVVVAEVKQGRRDRSWFLDVMRALGQREESLSKYCLGVASLDAHAKKNRYKRLLSRLHQTVADHDGTDGIDGSPAVAR